MKFGFDCPNGLSGNCLNGFYHIWAVGHDSHLGYVTLIIYVHISSPFLRYLIQNFVLIGQAVLEERFEW